MDKKITCLGMLVLVFFSVMLNISCSENKKNINGKWVEVNDTSYVLVLNNGDFEGFMYESVSAIRWRGTYTINGDKINMVVTHFHGDSPNIYRGIGRKGDSKWYSKDDFIEEFQDDLLFFADQEHFTNDLISGYFFTAEYFIVDNTLTNTVPYEYLKLNENSEIQTFVDYNTFTFIRELAP